MKILAISLLRLGDIVMMSPVLKGLKDRHPDAQLDVLVNSQFAGLSSLLPFVDHFIPFERDEIQKGLGESSRGYFESFDRLARLSRSLKAEKYDLVLNLTHNRMSGWIASLAGGKESRGLTMTENGRPVFGSQWFRYLNNYVTEGGSNPMHYVDIFLNGAGIQGGARRLALSESKAGRAEASASIPDSTRYYVVQTQTSDTKKNWPLERYIRSVELIQQRRSDLVPVFLGSPSEREPLEKAIKILEEKGIQAKAVVCSIDGAFSILKRAVFCLTGDTAIKHFACAADIPVVEISIGSSRYPFTGAYRNNCVIVQSKESCGPCPHSKPCHRERHACAERISPETAALACDRLLDSDWRGLRLLAQEYRDECEILRTAVTELGYWSAMPLDDEFGRGSFVRWLDRSSWRMLLTQEHRERVAGFGTESQGLNRALKNIWPSASHDEFKDVLAHIERDLQRTEARVEVFLNDLKACLMKFDDSAPLESLVRRLEDFARESNRDPLMASHSKQISSALAIPSVSGFLRVKSLRESLSEIRQRLAIELKLVRTMKNQIAEAR